MTGLPRLVRALRGGLGVALAVGLGVLGACSLVGCGDEQGELSLSSPDRALFVVETYPLLVRDCGFHACHGSSKRFYQVFGPGHGRLSAATGAFDPATPEEIEHSYRRAASMVNSRNPSDSLLLRKPLAAGAGGTGHEGVDLLGRDVYQTKLEPSYLVLERWVATSQSFPEGVP